jgi:tetratricopeptide (TPR) repeat protein
MHDPSAEKLRIFVSSTINECVKERSVAKNAIDSLNHEPILFEHIGARSTSAREVYLNRLDNSDIFIGIYRNNYGWIAPDSSISGIEDELRRSTQRGMPRLIYILEQPQNRDERLTELLCQVKEDVTIWKFRDADQLYLRIREDIEAEVTKRFHEADRLESIIHADAATEISGLVPASKTVLSRHGLEEDFLKFLDAHPVIQVSGDLGVGKTVFLASVARNNGFLFVSGTQLGNHELASVLANKLALSNGKSASYYVDASSSYSALSQFWESTEKFTLIVDDCRDPEFLSALLRNVGGATKHKRLIYSIRNADSQYGHEFFVVPTFSLVQVAEFIAKDGQELSSGTVEEIYRKSGGNPLYLLYLTHVEDINTQRTLSEYELAAWRSQLPLSREIASYLAIANRRVSLDELSGLAGREISSIEEIADAIQAARIFIAEFADGYTLRHEHQRVTVLAQLSATPSKLAYYTRRVANLLVSQKDHLRAYFILRGVDADIARKISRSALFEAQRRSDFKSQIVILDDVLGEVPDDSDSHDLMILLLSKAQALEHMGRGNELEPVFSKAAELAAKDNDPLLKLRVQEARTVYSAYTELTAEKIEALKKLEQNFAQLGDDWSAGRLTTELSVLFTRAKLFSESLSAAERGFEIFEKIGDEHGMTISRLNMATAMAALPGEEHRAAVLIQELQNKYEKAGTKRERAWLCNYMVRSLRRKKQFEEALKYGQEAVRIAEELGDLHLAASNRINIGNVYRDQGQFTLAIAEYSTASELSQRIGDKSGESSAARLTSSVYRRLNNNRLALEFAQVAVNLIQGTIASTELSDSLEEVGDCQYQTREWMAAAKSYAQAAAACEDVKEKSRLLVESISTCIDKELDISAYLDCLNIIYGPLSNIPAQPGEQLYYRLADIWKSIHFDYAIRVFGLHFRVMFENLPLQVARFIFRQTIRHLLSLSKHSPTWKLLFAAMPLLVSIPENFTRLPELLELANRIQDQIPSIHFKHSSGGFSWVVRLDFRQPVIVTIVCLDDRVDTLIAATFLTFFFKGFEDNISEMLSVPQISKREVDIYIGNIDAVPADVRPLFSEELRVCAVTRPSKAAQTDKNMPTFVVCSPNIGKEWRTGTGSGSAIQLLIARVLIELVYQLLKGEVDLEVLEPKIMEIVRSTIS